VASDVSCHSLSEAVVTVYDPQRILVRVGEQPGFVFVVLSDAGVSIEVIGTQIGEHANVGVETRRVVELEGGYLESNPVRLPLAQDDLGERCSDIPGGYGFEIEAPQYVRDHGGGRGLSVGTSDRDEARSIQEVKRDLHLAHYPHSFVAREREWRRVWRYPRAHDDQHGAAHPLQVVSPYLNRYSLCAELFRAPNGGLGRSSVRRVDLMAVFSEKRCRCTAASGETYDGDLGSARQSHGRIHRNFSVLSAMKANSTPMIQNRTTTCASSQPFSSK
jgi:hypothetical protein